MLAVILRGMVESALEKIEHLRYGHGMEVWQEAHVAQVQICLDTHFGDL
jgi:hypothetical protein